MKKDIQIDPNAGDIKVNISVLGIVIAGYTLSVYSPASNTPLVRYSGTNTYQGDDNYHLPGSAINNCERILMLITSFQGINENLPGAKCTITLEVYQGGDLVDTASEELEINNSTQESMVLVKLTC